jgi:AsmA protein
MKALKISGGVIAAFLVAAAALLAVGMPAGFLTSAIEKRVERETGYHLTVAGSTKFGLWPSPSVTMRNVTLERPGDADAGTRLSLDRIQADMTLHSLWSGEGEITELVIDHPALSIPLRRERQQVSKENSTGNSTANPTANSADTASSAAALPAPSIKRITVTNGTLTLFNTRDHVEDHIEGISVRATIGAPAAIP